jgi:hypothetical protein
MAEFKTRRRIRETQLERGDVAIFPIVVRGLARFGHAVGIVRVAG